MAAGAPVVCTDAHGNRDFCGDGVNCLMPATTPVPSARRSRPSSATPNCATRLPAGGRETAQAYALERKLDELDGFYRGLAEQRASGQMPDPVAQAIAVTTPLQRPARSG